MNIRSFLKLVEIQTKAASVLPYAIGTLYTLYRFGVWDGRSFALMLVSLLCIDMMATAINNYLDYQRAVRKHGFGYEHHNAMGKYKLTRANALAAIFALMAIAVLFGLLLVLRTNWIVLLLGALCFAVGILYSFGPVPISRTPFGEVFAALFMGLLIPLLGVYIHVGQTHLLAATLDGVRLHIWFAWQELALLVLVCVPAMAGIANIMLANNICDMQEDIENRRYTLPVYIGRRNALVLYRVLAYAGFPAVVAGVLLGALPWACLAVLLAVVPVARGVRDFVRQPSKAQTFPLAVRGFALVNAGLALTLAAGLVIQALP